MTRFFFDLARYEETTLDCTGNTKPGNLGRAVSYNRGLVDLRAIIVDEEVRKLKSQNELLWSSISLQNKELDAQLRLRGHAIQEMRHMEHDLAEKSKHVERLGKIIDETEAKRMADHEMLQYLEERCHDFCDKLDESSSMLRAKVEELTARDAYVSHLEIRLENARAENALWQQRSTELVGYLEELQRENMALKYEREGLKDDVDGLQTFITLWKKIITSYVDQEAGMRLGFEIHVENQMRIAETCGGGLDI